MDMCELYGCGSGSYWTREDLDELWGDVDDMLCPDGISLTAVYVKKHTAREAFDIDYRFVLYGAEYTGSLKKIITIDRRLAPTAQKLVEVYAPKIADAIRGEVAQIIREVTVDV